MSIQEYKNLEEFYPFYLSQHLNSICRKLHVYGTTVGLMLAFTLTIKGYFWGIFLGLAIGYGCSWIGHFFFEKNKPATFQYPLMSFTCDFLMIKDFYLGTLDDKLAKVRS